MAERLCFDPTKEDSANAPLELISADDDQITGVTEQAYPHGALMVQWAGSVDTEGELPASRKYGNRQINLTVEIADPGLTAATNKATNPKAAVDTTGWTNNSLVLMERQTTLPARLDPFDTAMHATCNADDDSAYLSAAVTNGVAETFTAWVYVVSGTVRLEVWTAGPANFASSANITVGSWQKIALPYTPNATATWTFRVCQNGAGTSEFYVTGAQIGPAYPYFDGDTVGCAWSGTRNASSSTRPAGETRRNAAVSQLEAKVAKIAREGGTLRRVLNDNTAITFDLHTGDTFDPVFDFAYQAGLAVIKVAFTAMPEGRGDEIDSGDNVETTSPALVFNVTGIKGDRPARGRLVVDEDQAQAQRLLRWGIQSKNYSSASTAALFYQAESCAMGAAAAAVGPAGASGGGSNTAFYGSLQPTGTWTSLVFVGASSTAQTHIGAYRVMARVWAPAANAGIVSMRLSWYPELGRTQVLNTSVAIADSAGAVVEDAWVLVDLGQINIPKAASGTQGWIGSVQANSTVLNDDVYVDWVMLVPIDEGSGEHSDPSTTGPQISASASVTIRHDGARVTVAGGYLPKLNLYEGDYLLIPPAGLEARTLRVIVKMARGTIPAFLAAGTSEAFYDPGTDDLSARLFYTPRYLVVPTA